MAWPPPVLPIDRTNATPQADQHPADHNAMALAINDIVDREVTSDVGLTLLRTSIQSFPQVQAWHPAFFEAATLARGGAAWADNAIVVPVTGMYLINLSVDFTAVNGGSGITYSTTSDPDGLAARALFPTLNGVNGQRQGGTASAFIPMSAGELIRMWVLGSSAVGVTTTYARLSAYLHSPGSIT